MKSTKKAYRAALLAAMLMSMLAASQAMAISRMPSGDGDTGGWWGNVVTLFHAPYHRVMEARLRLSTRLQAALRSDMRIPADDGGGGNAAGRGRVAEKLPLGSVVQD